MCCGLSKKRTGSDIHGLAGERVAYKALDINELDKRKDVGNRLGRRHGQFSAVREQLLDATFKRME